MRWMGALDPWASSTSLMIWASTVSFPTLVASNLNVPVLFRVAPITWSPRRFSTGRLSPVSMDSSTAEAPSRTTPSTGTFSPGRTITRSPIWTSSVGMSVSSPFRMTRAVFAWSPIRRLIASLVRPLAIASSRRPKRIRVMITAAVSKYTAGAIPRARKNPGATVMARLYRYADEVPTAIRVFMSEVLWRSAAQNPR